MLSVLIRLLMFYNGDAGIQEIHFPVCICFFV